EAADLNATMAALGARAREASAALALAAPEAKAAALRAAAHALRERSGTILAANADDIAALPDPVGRVLAAWTRPNGLDISRVSVPLGVIGIIYEARPNVTADAGGLAVKSGNAAILRGGS